MNRPAALSSPILIDVGVSLCVGAACRSETAKSDYITIYRDDTLVEWWGPGKKLGGSAGSGLWPGAAGQEPLIIPADHFTLVFTSKEEPRGYGYKVHASVSKGPDSVPARTSPWSPIHITITSPPSFLPSFLPLFMLAQVPVDPRAADALAASPVPEAYRSAVEDVFGPELTTWPLLAAEFALQVAENDSARAAELLNDEEEVKHILALAKAQLDDDRLIEGQRGGSFRDDQGLRTVLRVFASLPSIVVRDAYDSSGIVEVNLQSCEVLLRGRSLFPVPTIVSGVCLAAATPDPPPSNCSFPAMPEYGEVFSSGQQHLCALTSDRTHRQVYRIFQDEYMYDLYCWKRMDLSDLMKDNAQAAVTSLYEDGQESKGEAVPETKAAEESEDGLIGIAGTAENVYGIPHRVSTNSITFEGEVYARRYQSGRYGWVSDIFESEYDVSNIERDPKLWISETLYEVRGLVYHSV